MVSGATRALWILCLVCSAPVRAEQSTPEAAPSDTAAAYAAAIDAAVTAYRARRWTEALAAFRRAHELRPSARTWRGQGLAAFYSGDHATAVIAFERALSGPEAPLPADQRAEVESLLRKALDSVARIELKTEPADAEVLIDGTVSAADQRGRLVLEPGMHSVVARLPGHREASREVEVTGGERLSITLALIPVEPLSPRAPVEVAPVLSPPLSVAAQVEPASVELFTWVSAGASLGFAGGAGVFALLGRSEFDQLAAGCRRDDCDRAERDRRVAASPLGAYQTWTNIMLVASGAALATTVTLFVVDGATPGGAGASARLGPGQFTYGVRF